MTSNQILTILTEIGENVNVKTPLTKVSYITLFTNTVLIPTGTKVYLFDTVNELVYEYEKETDKTPIAWRGFDQIYGFNLVSPVCPKNPQLYGGIV